MEVAYNMGITFMEGDWKFYQGHGVIEDSLFNLKDDSMEQHNVLAKNTELAVINSYNDGSPEPGAVPLGPFYELETSSAAAALQPGETMKHVQRTFHIQGSEEQLNPLAKRFLGVRLSDIEVAL